ncbi:MAG: hypothetical protein RIS09_762 [Actinomycetota bacterium]
MFVKTYQDNDVQSVDSFRSAMNTLNQISKRKQPVSLYTRSAIRAGAKNPQLQRDLQLRRKVFTSIMLVFVFVILGIITGNLEFSAIMLPSFAIATYVFWVRSQLRETSSVKRAPVVKARSVRTHSLAALSKLRRQASELLTKTEPELATEATTAWQPLATFEQPEVVLPRYIEYKKEVAIDEPQVEWDATAMLEEAERQRRAQELAALVSDTEVTSVTRADDDTEDIPRVMGA